MSIDLLLSPVQPIQITPLLPKVSSVLGELLGLTVSTELSLMQLENGMRIPSLSGELGMSQPHVLVIAIAGEEESVLLSAGSDFIGVTAGGLRSNLEFALQAAVAIALARELDAEVWDDRKFFGEQTPTTPEALLQHMKVNESNDDYHVAAAKISWGPARARASS